MLFHDELFDYVLSSSRKSAVKIRNELEKSEKVCKNQSY